MIETYEHNGVTCVEGKVIRTGRKMGTVYVFLVDGMLIDTGPQCLLEDFIPFYEQHSFDLVSLTHSHEDHSGCGSWIEKNKNLPIYVHEKGLSFCRQGATYPLYRQMTWGSKEPFQPIAIGEKIQSRKLEWEVIYTPGHADDHVAFFNRETGNLFTGDLFVSPWTKVIMASESISVTMNSIRKLLTYDFEFMFCSHAGYVKDGRKRLEQKLEHLEGISKETLKLYNHGFSIEEINRQLFPKKYPIIEFSEGEWDSLHLISSVINEARVER